MSQDQDRSTSLSTILAAISFVYALMSYFFLPFLCPFNAFIPNDFFLRSSAQINELSERGISVFPFYVFLGVTVIALIALFIFVVRRAKQTTDFLYFTAIGILSIIAFGRLSLSVSGL